MSLYLGSQQYNGFAFTNSRLSEYPYEGFDTYQAAYESRDGTLPVQPAPTKPALKEEKEAFETMTKEKASTLAGSTYGDEKPVAFLYNNDSNTTCKNYGYTNSKGFICMSESDIKLLTTRGGNAVGVSDQIGK